MYSTLRTAFAALLCLAPPALTAQDLVTNGNFDAGLNSWTFPDASPMWSSFDMNGSATSGSAFFVNTQAGPYVSQLVLKQCIAIAQTGAYIVGISSYIPSVQNGSGYLIGGYSMDLHHADCSGGWSAAGGLFMSSQGAWTTYSTTVPSNPVLNVSIRDPEASISIELSVDKTTAGGSYGGYFDGAYLIRDTVFLDGFDP